MYNTNYWYEGVEGSKRSKTNLSGQDSWVYRRKQETDDTTSQPTVPTIQTTKEGDEKRRIIKPLPRPRSQRISPTPDATQPTPTTKEPTLRRFHLSKSSVPQAATTGPGSKKRASTAVFVERSSKRKSLNNKPLEYSQPANVQNGPPAVQPKPSAGYTYQEPPPADPNDTGVKRSFKRPGTRRFQPAPAGESLKAGASHPALPPSLVKRDVNVDMDQLAQEMDAYTLNAITSLLNKQDEADAKAAERKAKFKPHAPALRYAQRHPEAAAAASAPTKSATPQPTATIPAPMDDDEDIEMLDSDSEDYVIEQYYRVPASRLNEEEVSATTVGLLVFDSEPDKIDFFFGTEDDEEFEFPEDEDDENHENYYAADYPDEDLEWDDELDRNPYEYRTGNASDREEFDAEEFVDDEELFDDDDEHVEDDDGVENSVAADERFMDHVWRASGEMADMVAYATASTRGYEGDRAEPAVAGFPRGFPYE